jgi:hypothetical protein
MVKLVGKTPIPQQMRVIETAHPTLFRLAVFENNCTQRVHDGTLLHNLEQ